MMNTPKESPLRRSNPALAPAFGTNASNGKPFKVLALSGGGYLGLYTAMVLAALEQRAGVPLGQRFDLIAGTSVGGILAAAVALEVPLQEIVALFREQGTKVFSPRALPGGPVTRLLDMSRSVMGPKYSGVALRDALRQRLGERRMAEVPHALVLPAVNVTRSLTKVFKTPHAPGSRGDEEVAVLDAVMATCAAPAYFPAVPIGGQLFADGGLFAVAPDLVALHEAEHFMGVKLARVSMLSIGTATKGYSPAEGVALDAGAVGWLTDGRLLLTLISVQQQHMQAVMEDRLGKRYLRLDTQWPAHERLGIDVATPHAADVLEALASQTVRDVDTDQLKRFI
jgi:uncharacterized protein